MAAAAPQINIEAFDQLLKNLGNVYNKLTQIEKKVSDLENTTIKFKLSEDFKEGAKAINQISNAMKVLAGIDTAGIVQAAQNLQTFLDTISTAKIIGTSDSVNILNTFATALTKLGDVSASGSLKGIDKLVSSIRPMFDEIGKLLNSTSGVTPASISAMSQIFTALEPMFRGLANIIGSLQGLSFTDSFKVAGLFRNTVIPMLKALSDLVAAGAGVTPGSIKALKELFDELESLIIGLFMTFEQMQNLKFTNSRAVNNIFTTLLPSLFLAMGDLIKSAEFVTPERIGAVNLLMREVRGFLPVIQGMLLDLNGIPKINRRVIDLFRVGVVELMDALAKIMTASENAKPAALDKIPQIMVHSVEIVRSMQTLMEAAGKHSIGDILVIRGLFSQIPKLLDSIALIVASTENTQPARIAQVTLMVDAIGRLLDGIVKSFTLDGISGTAKTLVLAITVLPTIRRLLNTIGLILESTAGVTPERLRELNVLMVVVGELLETLQKVTQRSGSFGDTVKVIATGLLVMPRVRNFILAIRDVLVAAAGLTPAALTALSSVMLSVGDVIEVFGRIAAGAGVLRTIFNRLIAFPALMSVVNGVLNSVKKVIAVSSTVHPDALQGLGQVMRGLGDSLQAISQIMENISGLLGVGTGLLGTLGNLAALVVRLPALLLVLNVALGSVSRIIRTLIRTTADIDTSRLRALGEFAEGVGLAMTGMADIFLRIQQSKLNTLNPVTIVKQMVGISLALSPIFNVIKKLVQATKDVPGGNLGDLGNFVQGIGKVMQSTANIFESITKAPSGIGNIVRMVFMLGQVTKPITNLLKDIAKFSGKTDSKKVLDLKELILALSDVLGTFSKTLSGDDDIDAGRIKGISEIVKSLFGIFKNIKIDDAAVKGLRELNDAMKLLSVGDLKKDSIEVIRDLFTVLKTMGDIDTGKFNVKDIGLVFDTISTSINKLDIAKIRAFADIGEILRKLPDSTLTAGGSFEDLSDEFSEGAVGAAIKLKLLDVALSAIGSAIAAINPINMFATMIDWAGRAYAAVRQLFSSITDGGERIRQVGSDLVEFGQNIEQNFGVSKLLGSNAFQAAAEFDALGTQLEVFGGLSEDNAKAAQDFANVIGKDYPLSSNEALKATLDLIKAGQDLESVQKILPSAADLASLSDTQSIETSTGILIAATKTFKDFNDETAASFDNIAVASDILSAGADTSTASVESLGEGLKNVGPLAGQFGLSLEQTVAILAQFNDAGITGAEAGTQLKSVLTSFNSKAAQDEFRKLGVALTDNNGSFRDFNDIFTDLNQKMNETSVVSFKVTQGMSKDQETRGKEAEAALKRVERQRAIVEGGLNATSLDPEKAAKKLEELSQIEANAQGILLDVTGSSAEVQRITAEITRSELQNVESLKKLGGAYGQAGLAVLLEAGEDGLDKFIAKMREVDPAADRARKMLDNFKGDVTQLQGSLETLLTKAFLPLIEKVFRPFVQLGRLVIDSILGMDEATLEFITTAIALGSIFATVVAGLAIFAGGVFQVGGVVVTVVGMIGTAMTTLSLASAGLAVGFIAGLAAIAAAIAVLTPIIIGITAAFNAVLTIFREDLGGAASSAQKFFKLIGQAIGIVAEAVNNVLSVLGLLFQGSEVNGLEQTGEKIAGIFTRLGAVINSSKMVGALRRIQDLGNIFKTFFATMTQGSQSDAAAKQVADNFAFLDGAIEVGGEDIANAMDAARLRVIEEQAEMITDLVNNNKLLRDIFGGDLTREDVEGFLVQMTTMFDRIKASLGEVRNAFFDFFDNLKGAGFAAAFTQLGSDLDNALGNLVANILEAMRTLFKVDLGQDLENIFATAGFAAGMKAGIKRALGTLRKLVLDNRDSIRDVLIELFDFFFLSPINWGKFITDALGMDQLNGVFVELERIVRGIFGGIIDTIFNLMEGQDLNEALTNAFGPNIQPFLDLVTALGNAAGSIITIIGNLVTAIFGAGEGGEPPQILDILTQIANGLTSFIDLINTEVLSKLAAGDLSGALAGIVNLGLSLVQTIAQGILDSVNSIDIPAAFSAVASTIMLGLVDAVKTVLDTIGDFLGIDFSGALTSLDTAINAGLNAASSGSAEGLFVTTIATLSGLLAAAINGIFSTLGSVLNIDTSGVQETINTSLSQMIAAVERVFLGEDGSGSLFTRIADIVQKLVDSVTGLFDAFSGGDDITPKIDPIKLLIDQLARLVTFSMDTVTGILDGISDFLSVLEGFDAAEMAQFGLGLTVIAGGVAAFAGITAAGGISALLPLIMTFISGISLANISLMGLFSTALTGVGTAISTFAATTVGKLAGFIAIAVIVKNFVEELGTMATALQQFGEGDILGGIRTVVNGLLKIFLDIGTDVLKLLGIDQINGFMLNDIPNLVRQIGFLAQAGFAIAKSQIDALGKSIMKVIDDINFALIDLELQIARGALTLNSTDFQKQQFDASTQNIDVLAKFGKLELSPENRQAVIDSVGESFNTILQGAIDDPNNLTAKLLAEQVKIRARQEVDGITSEFAAALSESEGNLASLPEWAKFFNLTGTVDEALTKVIGTGDANLIQTFVDALLAQGVTIDTTVLNDIVGDILLGFNPADGPSYDAALAKMTALKESLLLAGVDTTVIDEAIKTLQAQRDGILLAAGEVMGGEDGEGVTVDVPLTLDPTLDNVIPLKPEEIQALIDEQLDVFDQIGIDVNLDNIPTDVTWTMATLTAAIQAAIDAQLNGGGVPVDVGADITPNPITIGPQFTPGETPAGIDFSTLFGGAPLAVPVDADLVVNPTGVVPTDPAAVQTAVDAAGEELTAAVPVQFDTTGLQSTEDVVAFQDAINGLAGDVLLLVNQLKSVPTTSLTVSSELAILTTNITLFRDTNVPLVDEVAARFDNLEIAASTALDSVIQRVGRLIIDLPILAAVSNVSLGLMSASFFIMAGAAAGAIAITINNLESLTVAIDDAADAAERLLANLTAAGKVGISGGGGGPGAGADGARAGGGITLPGKKYKVAEGGRSELLQEGDDLFLLSGQQGKVIPLQDIPDLSSGRFGGMMNPNLTSNPVSNGAGNTSNIVVNQGALNINVSGVDAANEAALVNRIKTEVGQQQARDNKRLADTLRTGHR